jgi:hypothetical protein
VHTNQVSARSSAASRASNRALLSQNGPVAQWIERQTSNLRALVRLQPGPLTTASHVTHDLAGAPHLAALVGGAMEAEGDGGGWTWILSDLKTLLETGKPLAG